MDGLRVVHKQRDIFFNITPVFLITCIVYECPTHIQINIYNISILCFNGCLLMIIIVPMTHANFKLNVQQYNLNTSLFCVR